MFKVGDYVVPKDEKVIQVLHEIEDIFGELILYMTDNTSYHIKQIMTIDEVVKEDKNYKKSFKL